MDASFWLLVDILGAFSFLILLDVLLLILTFACLSCEVLACPILVELFWQVSGYSRSVIAEMFGLVY